MAMALAVITSYLILPDFLKISKGIKKRRSSGKPIFFTAPETARLSLASDDNFSTGFKLAKNRKILHRKTFLLKVRRSFAISAKPDSVLVFPIISQTIRL